jgi:YVTN family beta-propeller protein
VYLPVADGLVVIDTATNTVKSMIPVEGMSTSVVLPNGSLVHATTYDDPLW